MNEYFEVKRGLRQRRVMSQWLFNEFFGRMVTRVNEKVRGRGSKWKDDNGRGYEIKQVLYADDAVLIAESREDLQQIVRG